MYESFFQLRERPFPSIPRADLYFPAGVIEHAYHTLARCVERAEGPGLLIGGPGTGKTLVCQLLAGRFDGTFHVVLLNSAPLCARRALLQAILFELDLPYRGLDESELRLTLFDYLEPRDGGCRGLLLLIDEAHTLPTRLFEEVRLITNLVRDGQPRVQVVLAGGPRLEERLASPKLETLNQRLAARCYLTPLNYDDTCAYVRSLLAKTGGDPDRLLAPDAWQAIYQASDGIPRLINQVCDHAFLLASVAARPQVGGDLIQEAWADLQQLPTPWQSAIVEAGSAETTGVVEFGALEDEATESRDAGEPESSEPAVPREMIDLTETLAAIELQLAEVDDASEDGTPTTSATVPDDRRSESSQALQPISDPPRPEVSGNPFDEPFEQEELVVDPYAAMQATAAMQRRDTLEVAAAILRERKLAEPVQPTPPPPPPPPSPFVPAAPAVEAAPVSAEQETLPEYELQPDDGAAVPVSVLETRPDWEELDPDASGDGSFAAPADHVAQPFRLAEAEDCGAYRRVSVMRQPPPDDNDMILIVDDNLQENPPRANLDKMHRQEYRRLFSRLRQS